MVSRLRALEMVQLAESNNFHRGDNDTTFSTCVTPTVTSNHHPTTIGTGGDELTTRLVPTTTTSVSSTWVSAPKHQLIIAVTANGDDLARNSGFDEVHSKPLSVNQIGQIVHDQFYHLNSSRI